MTSKLMALFHSKGEKAWREAVEEFIDEERRKPEQSDFVNIRDSKNLSAYSIAQNHRRFDKPFWSELKQCDERAFKVVIQFYDHIINHQSVEAEDDEVTFLWRYGESLRAGKKWRFRAVEDEYDDLVQSEGFQDLFLRAVLRQTGEPFLVKDIRALLLMQRSYADFPLLRLAHDVLEHWKRCPIGGLYDWCCLAVQLSHLNRRASPDEVLIGIEQTMRLLHELSQDDQYGEDHLKAIFARVLEAHSLHHLHGLQVAMTRAMRTGSDAVFDALMQASAVTS